MRGIRKVQWNLKQMFRSFRRSPIRFLQGFSLLVMTILLLANIGLIPGFLRVPLSKVLNFPFYTLANGVSITPLWIAMFIYAGTLMGLIRSGR